MQLHCNLMDNTSRPMLIAIAMSMLVCALIGGKAHQTVCSLAWETRTQVWGIRAAFLSGVRRLFDTLEPNHCHMSDIAFRKLTKREDTE